LLHALPPPPRGYDRVIVDGKVLLVEVATQVIHDILVDVVMH
jgi:Ni/Co efflux regulator RcnB